MRLRPLGECGLRVSEIALGTMNFGSDWLGIGALDEGRARRLVDIALDAGVNLFDTADVYGLGASESMLGKVLGKRRKKVLVSTKTLYPMDPRDPRSGGLSRRRILRAAEESLRRLKTDWLDLYMPHAPDPGVPPEESLEAFAALVKAGKVRALGCSNFPARELERWLGLSRSLKAPRLEFAQAEYSLAARSIERDLVPVCRSRRVGLLAWSPLAGGFLSGKYRAGRPRPAGARRSFAGAGFPPLPEARLEGLAAVLERIAAVERRTPAQTALAWLLGRPCLAAAVVGARTPEQLREDLAAAGRPLAPASGAFLDRAAAATERAAA